MDDIISIERKDLEELIATVIELTVEEIQKTKIAFKSLNIDSQKSAIATHGQENAWKTIANGKFLKIEKLISKIAGN